MDGASQMRIPAQNDSLSLTGRAGQGHLPSQGPRRRDCSTQGSLDTVSVLMANSEAHGTVLFADRPKSQGLSTTLESWQTSERAGAWAWIKGSGGDKSGGFVDETRGPEAGACVGTGGGEVPAAGCLWPPRALFAPLRPANACPSALALSLQSSRSRTGPSPWPHMAPPVSGLLLGITFVKPRNK